MEKKNNDFGKILIAIIITACLVYTGTSLSYLRKMADNNYISYDDQSYGKLEKVKKILNENFLFEYDDEKLLNGAINGMLESLEDPYTEYYTAEEWEQFMTETEGEYMGVGLYITYDTAKSTVIVLTPIENSPAAEAGFLPGDYIVSINEENVVGKSIDEVASLLKGIERKQS